MAKTSRLVIADIVRRQIARAKPGSTADLSRDIAAYLLAEHRTGELDSLMRDVMKLRAEMGIVEVVAVSARPLSAAAHAEVEAQAKRVYPTATTVIVSEQLDESLIGGVRLEFPEQQLDLSVRDRLNTFKQLTTAGKDV